MASASRGRVKGRTHPPSLSYVTPPGGPSSLMVPSLAKFLNSSRPQKPARFPSRGSAAGPSGATNEHLRIFLDDEEDTLRLHAAAKRIARAELPPPVLDALRVGRIGSDPSLSGTCCGAWWDGSWLPDFLRPTPVSLPTLPVRAQHESWN